MRLVGPGWGRVPTMLHSTDEQQTPLHLTIHLLKDNQGKRTTGGISDDCCRYFNVDTHTYIYVYVCFCTAFSIKIDIYENI